MLKIRLTRIGKTKQPSFRVVLQEHTAPVKGKFIEELGFYRPAAKPKEVKFELDRVKHWLKMGAQPSDTVAVLLKKQGVENMDAFIAPRNKKHLSKSAAPADASPGPAASA
ncbi:30S ribosomal protein S16 [Candidatus Peregrinibacteria bacterium]|nr:30S ribosomal protein S16 [Candidatus Peregrinibacteria bacterium]